MSVCVSASVSEPVSCEHIYGECASELVSFETTHARTRTFTPVFVYVRVTAYL